MILYIENPKNNIRKLLQLISEFNKVEGYKINTQKSFAFIYTDNKKSEREIKESIPFTNYNKKNLIPRNKLTSGDKRKLYYRKFSVLCTQKIIRH